MSKPTGHEACYSLPSLCGCSEVQYEFSAPCLSSQRAGVSRFCTVRFCTVRFACLCPARRHQPLFAPGAFCTSRFCTLFCTSRFCTLLHQPLFSAPCAARSSRRGKTTALSFRGPRKIRNSRTRTPGGVGVCIAGHFRMNIGHTQRCKGRWWRAELP